MKRSIIARGMICLGMSCLAVPSAFGASATLSFDTDEFCTNAPTLCANVLCANNPVPPLFNRPEFAGQTSAYIVGTAACGEGNCGAAQPQGSDSRLTSDFASTGARSNEARFSWEDPSNDDTWLRLLSFNSGGVIPKLQSPTVHLGVGSSVSMDISIYGTDGNESASCLPDAAGSQLEFSLIIRETGRNLPLGVDGGTTGDLEFVGITSKGGPVSDLNTPIGGTSVTHSASGTFTNVKWTFTAGGVDVSVNGGGATAKSVVGFVGDGTLSAANNRGTLDSIAIRKPAGSLTKKWYVYVDNIVIDAPNVIDPLLIEGPVSQLDTDVTVAFINDTDTTPPLPDGAEEIRFYINGGSPAATATPPYNDAPNRRHTFMGLSLSTDDVLTATQVIGGVEGPPSDPVIVTEGICLDDFSGGVVYTRTPATAANFAEWYEVNSQAFATVAAGTLDGSPAVNIDDGGFMNGGYIIYESAVPADGTYKITADMHITEDPANPNGIQQYQVGVIVNGVHRGVDPTTPGTCTDSCHNQALLAVDPTQPGNAVGNYVGLSAGDDSGLPTQTVSTGEFTALAGDNLLIVFSTMVDTEWSEVTPLANGQIDTLDGCEICSGFPPVCTGCANGQGTWNIRPNRSSSSVGWGGPAVVQVDNICLASPQPCEDTDPVVVATSPLVTGLTAVDVTGVDPTPEAVTVYSDVQGQIGQKTSSFAGTGTETVTVSALVSGETISATQTVAGVEGCVPDIGTVVDDCAQIPPANVSGPVNAGATSVTVTGIDGAATEVTVYSNVQGQIGQIPPPALAGGGTETVPVSALVKGEAISATQTISGLEGCVPAGGQIVGSGGNSGILLSLGIRQTNPSGAVGEDGGIGPTTEIEWIIDPANACSTAPPQGFLIEPEPAWQTVTFDPTNALAICNFNAGNSSFDGHTKGVLEHLAVSADPNSLDVGPYTLYVDNIVSAGVTLADGFEAPLVAGDQAIFRQPSFSGSSGPHIIAPPNASVVDDTQADTGSQSVRIEWRFIDEGANRWIRVTTNTTANFPNPIVDLTQPITMRVLLLPPGAVAPCNDPVFDADGDGDVDHEDWGAVQACITGINDPDNAFSSGACGCFDIDNDDDIDGDDVGNQTSPAPNTFEGCASGPTVPANPACDG